MLALSIPAATGSTWNPADNSSATLSNGNLTAAFQTSSAWNSIRSTNPGTKTSGKWHVEATATSIINNGWMFGVADSSAAIANYCGSDTHGMSVQMANTTNFYYVYLNGSQVTNKSGVTIGVGDVLAIEVDITNKLLWFQNATRGTGWSDAAFGFTGNPASGTSGISFSSVVTTGGVMLMGSGQYYSSTANTLTLNVGPSFVATVSSGFSAWG
jgi:hypothetical protein